MQGTRIRGKLSKGSVSKAGEAERERPLIVRRTLNVGVGARACSDERRTGQFRGNKISRRKRSEKARREVIETRCASTECGGVRESCCEEPDGDAGDAARVLRLARLGGEACSCRKVSSPRTKRRRRRRARGGRGSENSRRNGRRWGDSVGGGWRREARWKTRSRASGRGQFDAG